MLNIPWRTFLAWERNQKLPACFYDENDEKYYTLSEFEQCRQQGLDKKEFYIRAFRTEVDMTDEQRILFVKSLGILRFIYNLFIDVNHELHRIAVMQAKEGEKPQNYYMNDIKFSKWLNNQYLKYNPDKEWIKDCSSKAIKQVLKNAHRAYMDYFKNVVEYNRSPVKEPKKAPRLPRFKKKFVNEPSFYFIKDSVLVERHRVKIPIFGWLKLKEYGYLPRDAEPVSGNLTVRDGRIFVSIRFYVEKPKITNKIFSEGIGIDVGVKEFAIISTGQFFHNINKTRKIKYLSKKLDRLNRSISRKRKDGKKEKKKSNRLYAAYVKRRHLFFRLNSIRDDYIKKCVTELVRSKPAFVAIEDLNVRGMMKNRHLARHIAAQKFSDFKSLLIRKCQEAGIEVRLVDRWFPSSKTCHNCGFVKKDLKLKDRTFHCPQCKHTMDRDLNAALNLRDTKNYRVAA